MNNVEVMEGGELEIMHADKIEGLDLLAKGKDYKAEAVNYEHPGRMILAQGSEILHHVTRVENNIERWIVTKNQYITEISWIQVNLE